MDIKGCFSMIFFKRYKGIIIFLSVVCLWFTYFLWALRIGERTALMDSIPVWETHIIIGLIVGGVVAYIMKPFRPSQIEMLAFFIAAGVVGSVSALNIHAVYAYLSPGDVVNYEAEYKVRSLRGHHFRNSCSTALLIKDKHTENWIQFCKVGSEVYTETKYGMNTFMWVTARINKFGTYIIDYKFISESERNYLMNSGAESSM
jgi:hypothetical protein